MRTSLLVSSLMLSVASLAAAQTENDAVNLWLSGDDAAALPALAEEAASGDEDAQLLLGQIDRDTVAGGYSRYVLSLSPLERNRLLRANIEDGTRNWLLEQESRDLGPLSEALFNYRVTRDSIPMAVELQKEGETASAEYLLWTVLDNGRFDLLNTVPADNHGLLDMEALAWVRAYQERDDKRLTLAGLAEDPAPGMIPGLLLLKRLSPLLGLEDEIGAEVVDAIDVLNGRALSRNRAGLYDLNAWLDAVAPSDPHLATLQRYCESCDEAGDGTICMSDALAVVSGYRTLMTVRSPIERVVPTEAYFASERPVALLQDLVRNRTPYYAGNVNSACVVALNEEGAAQN